MTTDELNAIVKAVMDELEKAGVDFDFKAETPQPTDLVYVMRGTSDKYQGITVKWQNLLDIIVKKATDAKDEAVSAKDIALQTLATIQGIESNVSSMKSSIDASEANVASMKASVEASESRVTQIKAEAEQTLDEAQQTVSGKADKTYVDGELAKKADIAYVDGKLANKADKSELAVERARIDSLSKLSEGSTTGDAELIDLRIGADGVTYGNAGTAVRTQISDLKGDLGTEITEMTVNKGTLVANEYVKFETGEFLSFSGWSRTDYLPCGTYTEIKTNYSAMYAAFYDSNKQYISKAYFQADTFISVPQNAEYFAVSKTSNEIASLVITAKNKGMGYILNDKIENVEDITITEKTEYASSLIDGYFISDTGTQLETSTWVCTDYIDMPFDEKSGYAIRGTFYGIGGCAIYDKDNNMLLAINGNNVASYGGTASVGLQTIYIDGVSGARKIRISGYKTTTASASDLWIKGNTFNGVYEHLYDAEKDITEIKANISTTIASSKVLVIGDSISSDAYASYPKWVTVLKNQGFLPSDTTNSSQHATGFVARYNNQPNDFITRLKAIENPSQYDLVVVFGGINDYLQNIPMGEETGTDYTVSFKPAVNEFFNYLIENFTQARICVLLPLRTYQTWVNTEGNYQQAYGDYIKQVAKSYCLPILNLTEDSGFCPYIATFSNMWTLLPDGFQSHDGVHPNEEYQRRFLAPMIKHFLQGVL